MLDLIFQAYFDCRRRKRRTLEALQFEEQYEKHCLRLHHEIISCTYKPDNYKLIYVTDPVMREIFVPTFRDRVVHHLLANWLRPKLERIFIYDNYAGREGRGTLFGIRRAERFMRQVTQNCQKPAFVLKLDIASYFRSIPKERLWEKLEMLLCPSSSRSEQNHVCTFDSKSTQNCGEQINSLSTSAKEKLYSCRSDSICSQALVSEHSGEINNSEERERVLMNLLKTVIFHDPRKHYSGNIHPDFPKHKSLFSAPLDRGLPLGDLVSQLLGNFYLHQLDHFIKHTLRMKHYGRYMDDMIFFHEDRKVLENVTVQIRNFLAQQLNLELHEGKIVLNSCEQGILFLGAYIKPWRTYIGNRTKKNMYECLSERGEEKFEAQIQSYLGLMGHFSTARLQQKIARVVCTKN